MGFLQDLAVKIIGTPYVVGALVRQVVVVAAAALVSIGVLEPQLVDTWVNANVPVLIGLLLYLIQLGMSLKQKLEQAKATKALEMELVDSKYQLRQRDAEVLQLRGR